MTKDTIQAGTIDPGAGVVLSVNITDGDHKGVHILTSRSFRGAQFVTGGSAADDRLYSETAARESNEELFAKLVDMLDTEEFGEKMKTWGFNEEQATALKDALVSLSGTALYKALGKVSTAAALSEKELDIYEKSDDKGAVQYVRATFIADTVQATEIEAKQYLAAVSNVAQIMSGRYDAIQTQLKPDFTSKDKSGEDKVNFKALRECINNDYPGLSDFTESSQFGLVPAAGVATAIRDVIQKKDKPTVGLLDATFTTANVLVFAAGAKSAANIVGIIQNLGKPATVVGDVTVGLSVGGVSQTPQF